MEQAIEDAVKGGYPDLENHWDQVAVLKRVLPRSGESIMNMVLYNDPLFWKAIGKTRQWSEEPIFGDSRQPQWLYVWHDFIDCLADGKAPNDYFNELLK